MDYKIPKHLRPETKKWVETVLQTHMIEDHHFRLLTLAAEAFDRAAQAREAIAKHGVTYTDRFGAPRKRPEVSVEESARTAFARLVRELDLDAGPASDASRPPAIHSNRRK
jgi:phage terminase small subunit